MKRAEIPVNSYRADTGSEEFTQELGASIVEVLAGACVSGVVDDPLINRWILEAVHDDSELPRLPIPWLIITEASKHPGEKLDCGSLYFQWKSDGHIIDDFFPVAGHVLSQYTAFCDINAIPGMYRCYLKTQVLRAGAKYGRACDEGDQEQAERLYERLQVARKRLAEFDSGGTACLGGGNPMEEPDMPPRMFTDGIARTEVGVIFGETGSGKSHIARDLMLSLACGQDLLGCGTFNPTDENGGVVLYINAEDTGARLKQRLQNLITDHAQGALIKNALDTGKFIIPAGTKPDGSRIEQRDWLPLFAMREGAPVAQPGWAMMRSLIARYRPMLVVIDTWAKAVSATMAGLTNEGSKAVIAECHNTAIEFNCGILFVMHTTKGASASGAKGVSAIRGDGEILNSADWGLQVCKVEEGRRLAYMAKNRDGKEGADIAAFEWSGHNFRGIPLDTVKSKSEPKPAPPSSEEVQQIAVALHRVMYDHPELRTAEYALLRGTGTPAKQIREHIAEITNIPVSSALLEQAIKNAREAGTIAGGTYYDKIQRRTRPCLIPVGDSDDDDTGEPAQDDYEPEPEPLELSFDDENDDEIPF